MGGAPQPAQAGAQPEPARPSTPRKLRTNDGRVADVVTARTMLQTIGVDF